jgi:hypothetical protein
MNLNIIYFYILKLIYYIYFRGWSDINIIYNFIYHIFIKMGQHKSKPKNSDVFKSNFSMEEPLKYSISTKDIEFF